MQIVIKRVGEEPYISEANTLEDMQNIVGGYIETFVLPEQNIVPMNMCGVCNEEGRILELPINFYAHNKYIGRFPIHGDVFFIAFDPEDFIGLTNEQAAYIKNTLLAGVR